MTSAVAGIIDKKGGLRIVVTQRWRMRKHVGKGERLFVVPNMEVKEPVPWDDIPPLIETVQKHVAKTLAPTNDCGECTACCFQFYIDELKKPSKVLCEHCAIGFGCKNYQSRPESCRSFECSWLISQRRNYKMAPELRPDRCGAIFRDDTTTNDPLIIECHGAPNDDAWQWINSMQAAGWKVRNVIGYVGEK